MWWWLISPFCNDWRRVFFYFTVIFVLACYSSVVTWCPFQWTEQYVINIARYWQMVSAPVTQSYFNAKSDCIFWPANIKLGLKGLKGMDSKPVNYCKMHSYRAAVQSLCLLSFLFLLHVHAQKLVGLQAGWWYLPKWHNKHVCITIDVTRSRVDVFILHANRHHSNGQKRNSQQLNHAIMQLLFRAAKFR